MMGNPKMRFLLLSYYFNFLSCIKYIIFIIVFLLKNLFEKTAIFILNPGIINNLFLNKPFIARFTTNSALCSLTENLTFALSRNFVFEGPGHKTLILTYCE